MLTTSSCQDRVPIHAIVVEAPSIVRATGNVADGVKDWKHGLLSIRMARERVTANDRNQQQ
jgi:hypothetical protein